MSQLSAGLAITPADPTNVDAAELSAEKLTVRRSRLAAISDASLTVRRREIFGLIGPNGAGKTTLVNCLTGFQAPTEGRILVGRQSTAGWEPMRFRDGNARRTFQAGRLFKEMSDARRRRGRGGRVGARSPQGHCAFPRDSRLGGDLPAKSALPCGRVLPYTGQRRLRRSTCAMVTPPDICYSSMSRRLACRTPNDED